MSTNRAEIVVPQPDPTTVAAANAKGPTKPYELARGGIARLTANPTDVDAAAGVCQAYLALGLVEPAREVIRAPGGPLARMSEFAAVEARLAGAPSGRVSWRSRLAVFDGKFASLCGKYPDLAAHAATFRRIPHELDLFRTRDGNWQIRRRGAGPHAWVPDLLDTAGLVAHARLPHEPQRGLCGAYLVFGDRYGTLFDRVFTATEKMFLSFRPRIYVLEPDPLVFGPTLYTYGFAERLCDERVSLLVGADCLEELARRLNADERLPLPAHVVTLPPARPEFERRLKALLLNEAGVRRQRIAAAVVGARGYYETLPAAHWARRYNDSSAGPLRVLGITSRYTTVLQFAMRDLQAAFERGGHSFHLLKEQSDHELLGPGPMAAAIASYRPDLIVIIDHHRREYRDIIPANVPFVCWVQDELPNLYCRAAGAELGPLDFYIAFAPRHLVRHYGYPAAQGMYWTAATDQCLYSAAPLDAAELAPYRCDFSFVSNHSKLPAAFHEEHRRAASSADHRRLLDRLFEIMQADIASRPRTAFQRAARFVLEEAAQDTGLQPGTPETADQLARGYLHPLADLLFRQATLAWVADFCERTGRTLNLYGNGWEGHPRFRAYARGVAQNGRQLRAIYQASRINLQIMPFGAVHPRLLDGLAAGGFFLIRYSPLDVLHEPVRRLLNAVHGCGLRPDRAVGGQDAPVVAQALRDLAALRGEPAPGAEICLRENELEPLREMAESRFRRVAGAVFDTYPQVSFASAAEFEEMAERYLADTAGRADVAGRMRSVVLREYTYDALVGDLLTFLAQALRPSAGPV